MKLKVVLTGICSILKSQARIVLPNAAHVALNCEKSFTLPLHRAYIRYKLDDEKLNTPPDESVGAEGALYLDGVSIVFKTRPTSTTINYPGGGSHIPDVASMGQIYPGFSLKPEYTKPANSTSHADVAALLQIPGGDFQPPNVGANKKWHFFPTKGTVVRGPLAQAVELHIGFEGDACEIEIVPFGKTTPTSRLKFQHSSGEVEMVIGNTAVDDIFPDNPGELPAVGPDYHFEIYYRLTNLVDGDCPPIPYFEGLVENTGGGVSAHSHGAHHHDERTQLTVAKILSGFAIGKSRDAAAINLTSIKGIALGGANCPPNQWP